MLFGVREICDVVFKAKTNQKIGNKIFYKGEPVIYFDSLKTSTLEGAATTVYAQGGRGNARLVAWEGERTLTFTMEDALISPLGFMILSGAGLVEGTGDKKINVHVTETTTVDGATIYVEAEPSVADGADIYVMVLNDGEVSSEPLIGTKGAQIEGKGWAITIAKKGVYDPANNSVRLNDGDVVLVDYYTEKGAGTSQIEITPDKFGGNFYIEASTLFRTKAGVDMPAEFIIPNGKIQSNFTFTMASSGDPSTFTFTVDAFPDYTRFDKTKRVMAAIQIIEESAATSNAVRHETDSLDKEDSFGTIQENTKIPATAIYVAGDTEISVGEKARLAAAVEPADSTDRVSWEVNDNTIATVDSYGVVTGLKEGTVTVTAKAGNKSIAHDVAVTDSVG